MKKLNWLISRSEEVLIGLLILSASVILFANVVARYVFNLGFPWAEELVRYEIVWMVFLGGSVAAREGIHIGVDIIVKFAPPTISKLVKLCIHSVSIVFCVLVVFYGVELISQTKMFGQVSPAMQVPMWLVQLAIPIGAGLMAIRFTQHWLHTFCNQSNAPTNLENIG